MVPQQRLCASCRTRLKQPAPEGSLDVAMHNTLALEILNGVQQLLSSALHISL